MSLTPGTKLGPYEIPSPLGADGMGKVYGAPRDGKLKREVALKILPDGPRHLGLVRWVSRTGPALGLGAGKQSCSR